VPYDELLSVVKDLARQLAERDPDLGARYLKAATGEGTLVKDYTTPFIAEVVCVEQTKVQHKSTINRYIEWAGELTTVEECDRVKAGEYVTELLTASGLSRRTDQAPPVIALAILAVAGEQGPRSQQPVAWASSG
jgi:hypothetical protein